MEKICICCNFEMKTKDEIFYFIDRMILSVCHMAFFGFNSCANLKKKMKETILSLLKIFISQKANKKKNPFQRIVLYLSDILPFHPVQCLNEFLS